MDDCPEVNGTVLRRLTAAARNRYFYGKLLDKAHFDLEQTYFNRKRWLLNRLTLGSGVICGLGVIPSNDGSRLLINTGMAIDWLGREIIVPIPSPPIDPRQPTDPCGRPLGKPISGAHVVTLCLAYHECAAEMVPVLVGDCGEGPVCAASTICERYCVLVEDRDAPPILPTCGLPGLFSQPFDPAAYHKQLAAQISTSCGEVEGEPCVVLAKIHLPDAGPILPDMIDLSCRPLVQSNMLLAEELICLAGQPGGATPPPPPGKLTTVVELSWNHDGTMPLAEFLAKGLLVDFSDKIAPTTKHGRAWFLVSVEYPVGLEETRQPLYAPGTIVVQRVLDASIKVSGHQAHFAPDPRFKNTFLSVLKDAKVNQSAALCRVVLKCDFLKDPNGKSVDGDFLNATLPSGDGTPGGDFESWFFLTPQ